MNERILVTIGHPNSPTVILPFTLVNLGERTPRQAAKEVRKSVAENNGAFGFCVDVKFSPADFYWACFHSSTDEKPFLASDNYYWRVLPMTDDQYRMQGSYE